MNFKWEQFHNLYKPHRLFFLALYIGFCYVIIVVPPPFESWVVFPDAHLYMKQAKQSFLSMNMLSPTPKILDFPRPFTVPLFYRLFSHGSFHQAVLVQKIFYCVCCFVFCQTIIFHVRNNYLKMIAGAILLFYFTWWDIVGWNSLVLSESVSQSFMLLWFATLIFFWNKRSLTSLVLLVLCSILFSFTRDSWPYTIVLAALLMFIFFWKHKGSFRFYLGCFFVFTIILFFVQQQTAMIGQRYKIPLVNTLGVRIACDPEYVNWFKKEGAPDMDSLARRYGNTKVDTYQGVLSFYQVYWDSSVITLRDKWVVEHGKNTYMKFMLTHPSYFFLADQSPKQIERILTQDKYFIGPAKDFFANPGNVFPVFNNWFTLLLVVLLIGLFFGKGRDTLLLFPVFLLILTFSNALICYNADTLEVGRHLYIVEVMRQLLCILALIFIANIFWRAPEEPSRS